MKLFSLIFIIILLTNCSKPKTVLICGDHICINKTEAEQYFEENLSIEVKIIDKKLNKDEDLVELNLKENSSDGKKISISSKQNTKNSIKKLSKKEVEIIKKDIHKKNKKKITKKIIKKDDKTINKKKTKQIKLKSNKNVNKKSKDIIDVCAILTKCNIDEISKYLIEKGKNKSFPNITKRQ